MPNTSKYNSKLLRDEAPAAPAPRSGVIGTVNPYWLWQAEARKPSTARRAEGWKKRRKPASSQAA